MTGQESRKESGYRDRNSTAERALDILLLFDDTKLVISGAEVATSLSVARSTAYRYLQSLTGAGFLEESQSPPGYRLGPRVLELARLARKGVGLSSVAREPMLQLCSTTGESVLLTRRSGAWVVCLELEESPHPVRLSYERGHVLPVNAGAAAQVLLAWEAPEVVDSVLDSVELRRFTESTLTDRPAIKARLEQIRQQGFAVSRGELDDNVVGVAAPIRDARDRVVAAVSIAALASRLPPARVPDAVAAVAAAAASVSERLSLITA